MKDGKTETGPTRRVPASLRWTIAWTCAAGIAVMSLLPAIVFESIPSVAMVSDKVLHFLAYSIQALLMIWAYGTSAGLNIKPYVVTVIFCFCYGAILECLQGLLLPYDRAFSFGDMAANLLGAVTVAIPSFVSHRAR